MWGALYGNPSWSSFQKPFRQHRETLAHGGAHAIPSVVPPDIALGKAMAALRGMYAIATMRVVSSAVVWCGSVRYMSRTPRVRA